MNKTETLKTLAVLRAAYPNFYAKQDKMDIEAAVALWAGQFESIDYQLVNAAIQALISSRTEGWPPTIGEVKAEIVKLQNPNMLTEQEAWSIVRKAVSNSAYHAQEEWNKFPDIIKELVKPSDLASWATADDFNPDVAGSNFMRSYRVKLQRKTEQLMLPASVRMAIAEATQRLQIGVSNAEEN